MGGEDGGEGRVQGINKVTGWEYLAETKGQWGKKKKGKEADEQVKKLEGKLDTGLLEVNNNKTPNKQRKGKCKGFWDGGRIGWFYQNREHVRQGFMTAGVSAGLTSWGLWFDLDRCRGAAGLHICGKYHF